MFNDSKTVSNVSTGSLSIAVDIAIPQKPIESLTPVFNTSTFIIKQWNDGSAKNKMIKRVYHSQDM